MTDRLVDISFSEGGANPEDLIGATEWTGIDDATVRDPAVVFVFDSIEEKVELLRLDPHFVVSRNGNEAEWQPETPTLFGDVERDPMQATWYKKAVKERPVPPELVTWRKLGLPEFEPTGDRIFLRVPCKSAEQRDALVERYGLQIAKKTREVISARWPPRPQEDLSSLRFDPEKMSGETPGRAKWFYEVTGVQGSLLDDAKPLRRRHKTPGATQGVQTRERDDETQEAYCWYGDHWLPASHEYFYRHRESGGLHLQARCKSCERLRRQPPAPVMADPRYPIFVISKSRWQEDRALTIKTLLRDHVPFRVVVEPQEAEDYARIIPRDQILTLPFSNLGRGSIPARNWILDHASAEGFGRSWVLDDNIIEFRRLYKGRRIPCHAGVCLRVCEDFTDAHTNIAVSGLAYQMFVTAECPTPCYTNVHVYSAVLVNHSVRTRDGDPLRWRGRYNEDTDLCLQVLDAGWCTVLVNAFMANKLASMAMAGGNTDQLYAGDGRLAMARSLEAAWPGLVKTRWRFGRPQHVVRWDKFKTPLKLRADASVGNYDLRLSEVNEVRSDSLRRLLEDFRS